MILPKKEGLKVEDLIEADADAENSAREAAGKELPRSHVEKMINSDLTYEYLKDTDGLLFKGNIKGTIGNVDGKNYEIELGSNNEIVKSLVDGKELDREEAKRVLDDYGGIAYLREKMVGKLQNENKENNE